MSEPKEHGLIEALKDLATELDLIGIKLPSSTPVELCKVIRTLLQVVDKCEVDQ